MKNFILLLLLCSVYFLYGQRLATGSPERVIILQGEIITADRFGEALLGNLGGTPRVQMGVSAEKRDSLIEIFGDVLPSREHIMYIEIVPFTEEEQAARAEIASAPGQPIVVGRESGAVREHRVVRRGESGEVVVESRESDDPTLAPEFRIVVPDAQHDQMPARLTGFRFAPGDEVPDFTLNDVNGNSFTLSSLRGNYVLLNFWGTWCGPCIAGIPRMKEIHEIYKDIVQFVGVASRERSVEVWREGVERHELPWINVLDETGDITTKYNIGIWPTYYLIDPEGRFVARAFADPRMLSAVFENTFGGRGRNVAVGDKAPDFTLDDVNGNPFTLSSLRGNYVLLNFWGTWCIPCIRGIPRMKEFYEKHQHNIDIVGVATRERSIEFWQSEVERLELPWINVFNDSESAIHEKYDVGGFPTKFLISPDGSVLLRHVGGNVGDFYERVESIIGQ